jgi:hypothetical protein
MTNLVVYTCVFGDTDPLRDPLQPGRTRFVCFTDRPIKSRVWEIVRLPKRIAPKRACREYKQPSHLIFPDADATLWIDAQMILLVDPQQIAAQYPGEFTGFKHHKRQRIKDEAEAIIRAGKGKADAIHAQLAAYQAEGWDTEAEPQQAITNGGFMLRRHTERVKAFNDMWHHEVQTRTLRDQMSLDYCAARTGLQIDYFPGNVAQNPLARRLAYPHKPTNDF